MIDKLNVEWVAHDGCIVTKVQEKVKTDGGRVIEIPSYIAFNIGKSAEHIVKLHNEALNRRPT